MTFGRQKQSVVYLSAVEAIKPKCYKHFDCINLWSVESNYRQLACNDKDFFRNVLGPYETFVELFYGTHFTFVVSTPSMMHADVV